MEDKPKEQRGKIEKHVVNFSPPDERGFLVLVEKGRKLRNEEISIIQIVTLGIIIIQIYQ